MARKRLVRPKVDRDILYGEIVLENGGDFKEVKAIVENQFAFLRDQMAMGEFSTVRLPYLGKFYVKPGRLLCINLKKQKQL